MATLTFDEVLEPMSQAAMHAFGDLRQGVWDTIRNVVFLQIKQIATAIVDLVAGLVADPPYYTTDSAKVLVEMTIIAATQTIAAATELLITEVQAAMRLVLNAVRTTVTRATGVALF